MKPLDLLSHQAAVLEAHARYSAWRRAKQAHALRGEEIDRELQSADAALDALATLSPEDEVLR